MVSVLQHLLFYSQTKCTPLYYSSQLISHATTNSFQCNNLQMLLLILSYTLLYRVWLTVNSKTQALYVLSYSMVVLYSRDHEGLGFLVKNYWPKTRFTIPPRRLDSIGCTQSSTDMLSKQSKALSTSFYGNLFHRIFYWLTNWYQRKEKYY